MPRTVYIVVWIKKVRVFFLKQREDLMVLDVLARVGGLDLGVARRAELVEVREQVGDAILAEGVAAVGQDHWRSGLLVELLLAALAR